MSNEELAALADCVAILLDDIRRSKAQQNPQVNGGQYDADNPTSRKDDQNDERRSEVKAA